MLNFDEFNKIMIFGPAHEILVLISSASHDLETAHPFSFNRAFSTCIDLIVGNRDTVKSV